MNIVANVRAIWGRVVISVDGNRFSLTERYLQDEWYHLMVIRESGSVTTYIDNVLRSTIANSYNLTNLGTTVLFGALKTSFINSHFGMNSFRVFDVAADEALRLALFTEGVKR